MAVAGAVLSMFMKTLTWCQNASFGVQPSIFLVQAELDQCLCAWQIYSFRWLVGSDNGFLILGGGEGMRRLLCREKVPRQMLSMGIQAT